jgi:hypothetical protein
MHTIVLAINGRADAGSRAASAQTVSDYCRLILEELSPGLLTRSSAAGLFALRWRLALLWWRCCLSLLLGRWRCRARHLHRARLRAGLLYRALRLRSTEFLARLLDLLTLLEFLALLLGRLEIPLLEGSGLRQGPRLEAWRLRPWLVHPLLLGSGLFRSRLFESGLLVARLPQRARRLDRTGLRERARLLRLDGTRLRRFVLPRELVLAWRHVLT